MKKIVFAVVILCFLAVYATAADFWASKNSTKYHEPSCKLAQKIKQENLVTFSSPEEAVNAGYDPCKRCDPAVPMKHKN